MLLLPYGYPSSSFQYRHFMPALADRWRLAARISPDLWKLSWPLMETLERREVAIGLMEGLQANLAWSPKYQAYLRSIGRRR